MTDYENLGYLGEFGKDVEICSLVSPMVSHRLETGVFAFLSGFLKHNFPRIEKNWSECVINQQDQNLWQVKFTNIFLFRKSLRNFSCLELYILCITYGTRLFL